MKKKIILSSILALGVLGGVVGLTHGPKNISAATPEVLYLAPNANWKVDSARFAAYFFGNGEKWVSMTDSVGDGMYEVATPAGYPNVIFCRMNPNASANNWNNKWNQTSDLTVPTNGTNLYTVKEGTWDKGGGTWSVHKLAGEEVDPSEELLTLFGTYTNEGYYVRETEIYVDSKKITEDLKTYHPEKTYENLFHAKATTLKRTTYFEGNQLWMTNSDGTINSGYGTDENGKEYKNQLEIDFVANLGSKRYYIQSAFSMPTEEKRIQEKASLVNINDSFKKIIVVKDVINVTRDEDGITTMSIYDFLLKENSLEL